MVAFLELDQETGDTPKPATDLLPAPTVALPKAGERFSNEELHTRFGVPTYGGIRVNRENRCIVLVHRVGADSGYTNTDRGTDILYMGQNTDQDDLRNQEMTNTNNLALRRSKKEGYTVLYFIKEGNVLVFNSRVEYVMHRYGIEAKHDGKRHVVTSVPSEASGMEVEDDDYAKRRVVIEFTLRAVREVVEQSPSDHNEGMNKHAVTSDRPVARGQVGIEVIDSPPLTPEEIASIESYLAGPEPPSISKYEFLDIIMDDKKLEARIKSSDS